MKKLLYSAAALSLAFFAASCQQENLEPVGTGSNTVTYSVQVPDAIATKANPGSVAGVTELVYEVYRLDASGEIASLAYEDVVTLQNGKTKWDLELEFVKDQKFQVLFWAQKPNIGAYNTGDLREVSLNSAKLTANVDDYAAFAGYDYVTNCVSHKEGKVTLVRPISQIQVGTDAAGLVLGTEGSNKVNISLTSSSMVVKGLPTTYNVANGEASDDTQEVEYTVNAVPAGTFTANSKEYTYVAQNYVAFAASLGTTVEVDFTVKTSEGDVEHTVSNVPLKPNYRTNIVGNLITENADYSIDLEANWADEEYNVEVVVVRSAEELQEALNEIPAGSEGNIKLDGDIDLNDLFASLTKSSTNASLSLTVPAGVEFTIDLNGYTLTGVDETETSFGLITNKGNLTIVNSAEGKTGKIKLIATKDTGFNRYSSVISTQPGSILTVGAGVEIEHLGGTSMSYAIDVLTNGKGTSAVAVVDGATVQSPYRAIRQFLNGTEAVNSLTVKAGSVIKSTSGNKSIWMQDPSANANTGSLVVEEGAELYGNVYISATAGSTEWPVSASVAASALKNGSEVEISPKELVGYNVVLNDGVYVFEQSWSVNSEKTEYTVYTAAGLKWVAEQVNTMDYYINAPANILDNATVKVANDIDLRGAEWTPIGDYAFNRTAFRGVFDGQGHTISNFKITKQTSRTEKVAECSYGLFGNLYGTVKNLKIDNATVIPGQGRFAAALVGRLKEGALVDNCHITNSAVTIEHWQVGGIAGQVNDADIKNSSISKSTITGYAGVGAIAGFLMVAGDYVVENCEVNECHIVQNGSFGGDYDAMFGLVAGNLNNSGVVLTINNVTVENNSIKDNSSDVLVGYKEEGATVNIDGYEILAPGLGYNKTSKTYAVSSAEGLVSMSKTTIKGGESVVLTADIDLTGIEFNGLKAFNPEPNNTFDGQGHTVSNWTNESGASDMAFIKSWVGTIKNVTVENASLMTAGRSAVLAGNVYANIVNCHVVNSTIEDSYWACGVIAGLYNSGSITNCSVDGCSVKSNGGVGGIVGVINESAGERIVENCTVKNTTVNNTGVYGAGYSGALVAGMLNADGATFKFANCKLENNTKEGQYVGDLFYSADSKTVYVDGVLQ